MAKTLREHEEICNIRYAAIDSRLTNLEEKLDQIHRGIDEFKTFIIKLAIKCAVGIAIALCSAVFVVKL